MDRLPLDWQADGPQGAPTLVLLGSVGSSMQMWEPCLEPLAERFRVVRIDMRGHGRSAPAPPGLPCSLADLGNDVLGVLDQIGAARVHLAGLSLGGMIAMWLAVHHPERIGRLALLCTSAHLPPAQNWTDRAAAVRAGGMEAVADTVLARWTTPDLAARNPELVAGLRAMFTATDAESYAQCCEAIGVMDQRADLGRIAAPTLVIGAVQDLSTPPEHQRLIAGAIPGARLELLDPSAHLATVERPGEIAALLLDHLCAPVPGEAGPISPE